MEERAASGGVWPVAVLFGAVGASAAALGAWLAALVTGATRPWSVLDWVAEHALWGTLVGGLMALMMRLGADFDPSLADAGRRRAAAARLATVCVGAGVVGLATTVAGNLGNVGVRLGIQLCGSALGMGAAWLLLARSLARSWRFESLRALDPIRTATLLAVLTVPLAGGAPGGPDRPEKRSEVPSVHRVGLPPTLAEGWGEALAGHEAVRRRS